MSLREKAEAAITEAEITIPANSTKEPEQAAIKRLASLAPIDYDRARKQEAEKLGISVGTLDKAVAEMRKQSTSDNTQPFDEIEPYHDPINPAQLIDEISKTIRRFIVLDKYQADMAALWVAACWFIDQIQVAPILLINAPEKACGKTQLLTVLSKLAPHAAQLSGISPSVLFRMIEKYQPTIFADEIETVLKDNEDLRGLLNAGHSRDSAFVWRSVAAGDDFEPKRFSVWGMKAVAGINAVKLAETVTSRAVILELRRKKPDECVDRLRYAEPGLFEELAAKLARFAADYADEVRQARPVLPDDLSDREQDNVEPLLQIAMVTGAHWPDTAIKAALKIFKSSQNNQSTANELLFDIQEIFDTKAILKISISDLINALIADGEKSWQTYNHGKALTARQLTGKLRDYGIYSKTIRLGYETAKGYELDQFNDVFDRYLSRCTPLPSVTPSQKNVTENGNVTDVTEAQTQKVTRKPAPALDCDNVTEKTPPASNSIRI